MLTHHCWKWIVAALLGAGPLLLAAPPTATNAAPDLGVFLAQHGYLPIWVENNGHNREIVRARINGSNATLVLDTGSGRTCITNSFARNLKLDILKADATVGVGGKLTGAGIAFLDTISLNDSPINHPSIIGVLPPGADAPEDGLLGYDYMRMNSVILPVGGNYFLYKSGPGPPPDFDSLLKTSGFQPIPLTFGEGGLRVTGNLDGHPFVAVVDCGANYAVFDSEFVKMTVGALVQSSRMIYRGVDGRPMFVGIFQADKLTFGGLTFPPTRTSTASFTTLRTIHVQALLGYDLLAEHHAIIDLGHDVLWMK